MSERKVIIVGGGNWGDMMTHLNELSREAGANVIMMTREEFLERDGDLRVITIDDVINDEVMLKVSAGKPTIARLEPFEPKPEGPRSYKDTRRLGKRAKRRSNAQKRR